MVTYGGWAYGTPRNLLVDPELTPVSVAPLRVTVGAARAATTTWPATARQKTDSRAKSMLVCDRIEISPREPS